MTTTKRKTSDIIYTAENSPILNSVNKIHSDIVIDSLEFSVGRSLGNSCTLRDIDISRNHCVLKYCMDTKTWSITDKSTFGTFINGRKLTKGVPFTLTNLDRIKFGATTMEEYEFNFGFIKRQRFELNVSGPSQTIVESEDIPNAIQESQDILDAIVDSLGTDMNVNNSCKSDVCKVTIKNLEKKYDSEKNKVITMSTNIICLEGVLKEHDATEKILKGKIVSVTEQKEAAEHQVLTERINMSEKLRQLQIRLLQKDSELQQICSEIPAKPEIPEIPEITETPEKIEQPEIPENEEIKPLPENVNPNETNSRDIDSELQCSICSELFIKATTVNCSHTFCDYCIKKWMVTSKMCPICRGNIRSQNHSLALDNIIDKTIENSTEEIKNKRLEIVEERKVIALFESKNRLANGSMRTRTRGRGRSRTTNRRGTRRSAAEVIVLEDSFNNGGDVYNVPFPNEPINISSDESSDESWGLDSISEFITSGGFNFSFDVAGTDGAEDNEGHSDEHSQNDAFHAFITRQILGGRVPRRNVTVPGILGSYYGGYGYCYNCGAEGHWAPGCPNSM